MAAVIFALYDRVLVKLGGSESHVYSRDGLMFTEVQEIERVTGLSYAEWHQKLGEYSITAVAALLHVLRKREGASDFGSMQFAVADLDVVPLHDDGREYTPEEVAADLKRRVEAAAGGNGAGPTAAGATSPAAAASHPIPPAPTSRSSPSGSESAPGSGTGSPTATGSPARRTSTPS